MTPDNDDVMTVLKEYANKKDGKWMLKTAIVKNLSQHDTIVEQICQLGEKAGYTVYGDTPSRRTTLRLRNIPHIERVQEIDVLWYKDGSIQYEFEVEHSTAVTEAIVRGSNIPYPVKRFIVIPDERANFLTRKLEEPALKELISANNWLFIGYDDLIRFYNTHERRTKIDASDIDSLGRIPKKVRDGQLDSFQS